EGRKGSGVPARLTGHEVERHDPVLAVREPGLGTTRHIETPAETGQVELLPELRAGGGVDGHEGVFRPDEKFGRVALTQPLDARAGPKAPDGVRRGGLLCGDRAPGKHARADDKR